jgi:hypothetical protein
MIRFRVAAQANTVRFFGRTISEADDFVFRFARIPARRHVQTARPVALFAGNILHRVPTPAIVFGEVRMTGSALFRACCLRAGNFQELAEVLRDLVRLSLGRVLGRERRSEEQGAGTQKGKEQSTWSHADLHNCSE